MAFGPTAGGWGSSAGADIGTERQPYQGLAFGAVTRLITALVIVWVWRSGNSTVAIPFAWWLPSYLLMIAIVYGW